MSDDERLGKLEEQLRNFRIVSGNSQIVPKFDKPAKDTAQIPIAERIASLEKIHKEFRIVGAGNVRVEGSLEKGFCINANCPDPNAGGDGFPNVFPPPIPTGACCDEEGNCTVTTQDDCEGTWLVGQDCDPNPCVGACCDEEGNCTVTTEGDCVGTWQGGGTDCDPNPCEPPECACFFNGFEETGQYLNASMVCSASLSVTGSDAAASWSASASTQIDPNTCEVTCTSFSGSGTSSRTSGGIECEGTVTATSCVAGSCLCLGNCSFSLLTVSTAPFGMGGYLQWAFSGVPPCESYFGCSNTTWSPTAVNTISDTVLETEWIGTYGSFIVNVTTTITLSNPCTPV